MSDHRQRVLGAPRDRTLKVVDSAPANSSYAVGNDISILLDEILNNLIRSVLVYDISTGTFGDYELCSVAAMMKYNRSVVSFNVCGALVGDAAVSVLCDNLVHSRVQYLDLSNTPLEDSSGRSLLALANKNPNIRTIVVDETLIDEELLDDIDMACLNNEKSFPEPQLCPIDLNRPRYCVAFLFGMCPHGGMCLLLHSVPSLDDVTSLVEGKDEPGGLPPLPAEGASWMPPGSAAPQFVLDMSSGNPRRKSRRRKESSVTSRMLNVTNLLLISAAVGVVALMFAKFRRSQI